MAFTIDESLYDVRLEDLGMEYGDKVIEYMNKKGIFTVDDFIEKQKSVPHKWGKYIKSMVVFNVDLTAYDFKE